MSEFFPPLQKIKEITYMHSEGILAGELKHGPLALVDKLMPVIMIIMRDHTYAKCQNALQQVIARQVRALQGCRGAAPDRKGTHRPPLCSPGCPCPPVSSLGAVGISQQSLQQLQKPGMVSLTLKYPPGHVKLFGSQLNPIGSIFGAEFGSV